MYSDDAPVWVWATSLTLAASFLPAYLLWKYKRKFMEPLVGMPLLWYFGTIETVAWLAVYWWYGESVLIYEPLAGLTVVAFEADSVKWWHWFLSAVWLYMMYYFLDEALTPDVPDDANPESGTQGD